MQYELEGKLRPYLDVGAWHFLSVPAELGDELKAQRDPSVKGFGSLKVKVQIGDYIWNTSIFPDTKMGFFLLPVKKEARERNNISDGDIVSYKMTVL